LERDFERVGFVGVWLNLKINSEQCTFANATNSTITTIFNPFSDASADQGAGSQAAVSGDHGHSATAAAV
jgi:hypothetical protein